MDKSHLPEPTDRTEWRPSEVGATVALVEVETPALSVPAVRPRVIRETTHHQQVLDKLAPRGRVRALDEELARWGHWQMFAPPATHEELTSRVTSPVLTR